MNDLPGIAVREVMPARLRWAAVLGIAPTFVWLVLSGIVVAGPSGWRGFIGPGYLMFWIASVAVPAVAQIILGWLMFRRRYWAMLALLVFGSGLALGRTLQMSQGYLGFNVASVSWMGLPVAVICGALLGLRELETNPRSIVRARRRAGIELYIAAVPMVAMPVWLGMVMWTAFDAFGRQWTEYQTNWMAGLCVGGSLMVAAAMCSVRVGLQLRRGERPGIGYIIVAFIAGTLVIAISEMLRAYYVGGGMLTLVIAEWVQLPIYGAAVVAATDLLHARCNTAEPVSYGFAPILPAEPVLPGEETHG